MQHVERRLNVWQLIRATCRNLAVNDLFRMAGATAFFSTFALPPILMIVVRILGIFSDRRTVGRAFLDALEKIFGPYSAATILQTVRSFRALEHNYLATVGLFIFLLFVATSLFTVIRRSIDQLWRIRPSAGSNVVDVLKARVISVAVMVAGGLLFLGFQVVLAGQQLLQREVNEVSTAAALFVGQAFNIILNVLVATLWLYLLFVLLPDGKPDRKIALTGAVVSALLFTAGKALLRVLLQPVRVNHFYGVSGAIALVLLFMFYSSIFVYFGASLIDALSDAKDKPVPPKKHAERFKMVKAD